jgi:hypothetical protein
MRYFSIVGQPLRARDCFVDVRDGSIAPAAHLVAEKTEPSGPPAPDCALGDNAALRAVVVGDRRHLDDEASLRHAYIERRVIELARAAPLAARHQGLEDSPVQAHGTSARAERQPVEVDAVVHRRKHRA